MKKMMTSLAVCIFLLFAGPLHAQDEVNLYAANSEDSIQVVLDTARQQAPGLKVNVIRAKTGALLQRIVAEKSNPAGDLFWSSGFGTLAGYAEVAESYVSPWEKTVPRSLHGPDHKWLGTNVHVVVLMANTRQLKGAPPGGWKDILDGAPEYRVAFADPSASSSAYLQLFGIYKKYGEEGVRKLARRVTVTGSSSSVYKGVAQGEYPVGITIEYAAYRYVAGGQKSIRLVYPEEGTFLSPEGMFVVKNAPNPRNAKRLFDIIMSKEAQERIFENSYRRPTRTDVAVSEKSKLPDFGDLSIFALDQKEAGAEKQKLITLWKRSLAAN